MARTRTRITQLPSVSAPACPRRLPPQSVALPPRQLLLFLESYHAESHVTGLNFGEGTEVPASTLCQRE